FFETEQSRLETANAEMIGCTGEPLTSMPPDTYVCRVPFASDLAVLDTVSFPITSVLQEELALWVGCSVVRDRFQCFFPSDTETGLPLEYVELPRSVEYVENAR